MSTADKLNYAINAKLDIQKACIYQGVDLPDNAPFGDYGKYIRLLDTGGGFASEYEFTIIPDKDIDGFVLNINVLLLKHGIRTIKGTLDNDISFILTSDIPEDTNAYITLEYESDEVLTAGMHKIKLSSTQGETNFFITDVQYDSAGSYGILSLPGLSTNSNHWNMGWQFKMNSTCKCKGIRLYMPATQTCTCYLWHSNGTKLGEVQINVQANKWIEQRFNSPILLQQNEQYILSTYNPSDRYYCTASECTFNPKLQYITGKYDSTTEIMPRNSESNRMYPIIDVLL